MPSLISQFVLLTLCAVTFAATAAQPDTNYAGEYVMQGKGCGPNDRAYAGTCSLQTRRPRLQGFLLQSRHASHLSGKGLAIGDTLAILIGDLLQGDHNVTYAGEYLIVYQREANGNLTGKWLHTTSPAAGMETLTRKK